MSLVKVFTEIEDGIMTCLPAKIIESKGDKYNVVYLSATDARDSHNRKIYKYEDEVYEITNESITEYLNSDTEIDIGFKKISDDEFVKYDTDSDDDYVPSSEEDSSDDESSDGSDDDAEFDENESIYDDSD
jgi:hypothetical protein